MSQTLAHRQAKQNQYYRNTGTPPTNFYIAIYSVIDTTEFTGTGYARQPIARGATEFTAPAGDPDAEVTNTNLVQFTASAPADWPASAVQVKCFDASTAGTELASYTLPAPISINTGSPVEFLAGAIKFKLPSG